MPPYGRVLERQGDMAGRLAAQGIKEMGEGEAGWREYWSPGSPISVTGLDCLWEGPAVGRGRSW